MYGLVSYILEISKFTGPLTRLQLSGSVSWNNFSFASNSKDRYFFHTCL